MDARGVQGAAWARCGRGEGEQGRCRKRGMLEGRVHRGAEGGYSLAPPGGEEAIKLSGALASRLGAGPMTNTGALPPPLDRLPAGQLALACESLPALHVRWSSS